MIDIQLLPTKYYQLMESTSLSKSGETNTSMAQLAIQQVQMLPNRNIDTGLFFGPKQYCIHSFVHGLLLSVWDKSIN